MKPVPIGGKTRSFDRVVLDSRRYPRMAAPVKGFG
jgi:hypothetical protein